MNTVVQMKVDNDDYRLRKFDEFNKVYPHNPSRRDKVKARALFMRITAPGGTDTRSKNKDSGGLEDLHLEASADDIVKAAKAYWKSLPAVSQTSYSRDTTYVPYAYVWLNQGRYEDYLED